MKQNQVAVIPAKPNKNLKRVAESAAKTFFMYGTITRGEGRKKVTQRAIVAGVQTAPGAIRLGLSVCSNKDRFVKAKGKAIALGRANSSNKVHDVLYLTDDTTPSKQFVIKATKIVVPTKKKGITEAESILLN